MKKKMILAAPLLASLAASAQNDFEPFRNRDFTFDLLHIVSSIIVAFLMVAFILSVIKIFLESRLKHKMIEKGASENVITQLLQTVNQDSRHVAIKWFFILAGLGLGLALVDAFQPLGIHSLAIMSFSIAASFLGYYYFVKRAKD